MQKFRLNPDYIIQQVGDKYAMIPCGIDDNVDFSKMPVLNRSAMTLVEKLKDEQLNLNELTDIMTDIYDVEEPQARVDIAEMIGKMVSLGLLRIV